MNLKQRLSSMQAPIFFFFFFQSWIILEAQEIHLHPALLLGPFQHAWPHSLPWGSTG